MNFSNFTIGNTSNNNNEQEMVNQFQNISLSDNNNQILFNHANNNITDNNNVTANLPILVQEIHSNSAATQINAVTAIRKLLCIQTNPPIDAVLQSGILPTLVQFATLFDNPHLQFESIWLITNIASGSSQHTETVVNSGVVPILIQILIQSQNEDVIEQTIWALGNIAGDSAKCRDFVLQQGIMQPLLGILQKTPKLSTVRNATWTLSNLFRGKPVPSTDLVLPAIPTLSILLYNGDEVVLCDAAWALSYFSDGSDEKIQMLIEANVTRRLVELLMHHDPTVVTPVLRTIGNIATGNEFQTQILIYASVLPCLNYLLSHSKTGIRKEACWTISNVIAGNKTQIQCVIDANIIPQIIMLLASPSETYDVKKEALWAISNLIAGGNEEQIAYTVSQGGLKVIIDLLDNCSDVRILNLLLTSIKTILNIGNISSSETGVNPYIRPIEELGGFEKGRLLTNHLSEEVKIIAREILTFVENTDTEMY
ncbi:hypothetical protein ABK040_016254 [Willaertia magna]